MSKNHGIHTSEWVSLGHPDKLADFITSYILDRYLERDPNTRYAVECLIKGETVVLAGEVTSKADISHDDLKMYARTAVLKAGYDRVYQDKWGAANTICGDDLDVKVLVGRQSPDIAFGVDNNGWGDQGIFWGMAVADGETGYMPRDHWLARRIGEAVVQSGIGGIDVKTLVTTDDVGTPTKVVCAVPMLPNEDVAKIESVICGIAPGADLIINGTGRYVTHGPIADCGVTGRKLAVDFYGGNCRVGGGSPWGKDATKADVTLNIYARKMAMPELVWYRLDKVYCSISCCIGRSDITLDVYNEKMKHLDSVALNTDIDELISILQLRAPFYAARCRNGLFHDIN